MKRLIALLVVPLALLLAACGETVLDSEGLEETLPHDLRPSLSEPVKSATCPDDVEVEKGVKFSCEITLKSGEKQTVELELTNDDADYRVLALSPSK